MGKTKIPWAEETWNPLVGCTRESTGCENCYAERMAYRLALIAQTRIKDGQDPGKLAIYGQVVNLARKHWNGKIVLHEPTLEAYFNKGGADVFVNSMGDVHHSNAARADQDRVYAAMALCLGHRFRVLTKRAELMRDYINDPDTVLRVMETVNSWPTENFGPDQWISQRSFVWPLPNVWVGVSVENADQLYRVDMLRKTQAAVRFLSVEPLLGPIPEIDLTGIDQVKVGCESQHGARDFDENNVRRIRDICIEQGVAFFYKQKPGKRRGSVIETPELDGRTWTQHPGFDMHQNREVAE